MRHVFIMNDTKKNHDFEKNIHEIMKEKDYKIVYTHSMQEVSHCIQECTTPSRIYSVGGDGSINHVIQALIHSEHELVVIPYGTGNDFCRMLTQERNPVKLLKQSLHCTSQKIDTILLNDRYFINAACFGVDSVIASHVHDTPNIPIVPESKSYIVSILQQVFQYQYDEVEIISEGEILFKGPVTLCTLNNAKYYGGGFQITPQANIEDGYMDICVVDKIPKAKIPYMLTFLLNKTLHKRKEVHYFKVKEAIVHTSQTCNMDGEDVQYAQYHLKIIPKSINIVQYQ